MFAALLLTAMLTQTTPALAAEIEDTCAGSMRQMDDCEAGRLKLAEILLVRAYRKTATSVSASDLKALNKSQRAWLAFRDAECVWQGLEFEGGSLQPYLEMQCRTDLTLARVQQLESWGQDLPK